MSSGGTSSLGRDALALALLPDPRSPTPLYLQLAERLRLVIGGGHVQPGEAMPAERELADLAGVSRVTVRRAIDGLVREGLLQPRPGAGTFVARRFEQPLSVLLGFTEDMLARGLRPGSVWLTKAGGLATPREALALALSPGDPVMRFERVRTADGEPIAIERATLSAAHLPSPALVEESLYAALRARGLAAVRALQRLQADLADAGEAALLGVAEGAAVLRIERRSFLEDGTAVEFTRSSYRAELYDFVAELRAPGG
jgi:GntR family transcriptional regulator